ncbi:Catalase-peroxidase [Rhodobacteraceae bacterium THAF1]|uniref:catalase/peroxidase HPI n=1 Tax=Palleronia sp. THAF1 TaxID=2587842 RepID=UPI000F3D5214|nr:catalase/peroxidase HPI [Palleronia sp. THAF1]QFU09500.1 Catalase-peroxidase [Palleronia sp. THAF1]VDC21819.1 Catalase-peroxidase [Rhodobacteraceae bacterium THAF1]
MKDQNEHGATQGACPFRGTRIGGAQGTDPQLDHWWPNRLKVELLHQNGPQANPLGEDFDYAAKIEELDVDQLKEDVREALRTPVDWWPADYGHYGPQMCRMSWHSAGTYRIADGRGGAGQGMQRFGPVNSWWDNGNIDKSRRLMLPIKQKYGTQVSWADLIVLAGTIGMEDMGLPLQGFAFGREDAWEADQATYWGPEGWNGKSIDEAPRGPLEGHPGQMVNRGIRWEGDPKDDHYDLENPLGASHQSLIYVDPEGPNGNGDPMDAARDIRETFARMAMNDEETVALVAGGHAFGKSHGMTPPDEIGPAPEGAPMSAQGFGWHNPRGTGNAEYTMTNGIEGSWTPNPIKWDNDYLENLFKFEWEQTKSPAGALQWTPVAGQNAPTTPDAHIEGKEHPLMMMTTDIAFKVDPEYRKICEKFLADFDYFTEAFSKAWHKLIHRDMGPKDRYLGPDVGPDFIWQDPVPAVDHPLVDDADVATLKQACLDTGLSVRELIAVAFASASTYRDTDKRGGANGARIQLDPLNGWEVNNPTMLSRVLEKLEGVKADFDGKASGGKKISMADLIVLAGAAGVEKAAKDGGHDITVPFTPGRTDATAEQTDPEQMDFLQPVADGFRNYINTDVRFGVAPEHLFLDRAALLKLTTWEWTALTGGLRVLDQNYDGSQHGVFTDRPGVLSNDFFKVLCSMDYEWKPHDEAESTFDIVTRNGGEQKFTATRCDLVFGTNSTLRQSAELYAGSDGEERLVKDFVRAWTKVMMADRYDVPAERKAAFSIC